MKLIIVFILLAPFTLQKEGMTVVKNNGDIIKLSQLTVFQSENNSSNNSIDYLSNGSERNVSFDKIRRINLKELHNRKKGIETWNALIVMRNNDKFEIKLALNKVVGMNFSGEQVEVNANSLDKISF